MKSKSPVTKSSDHPMAIFLRNARPTAAARAVVAKDKRSVKLEWCKVIPDLDESEDVIYDGYDPAGPLGPTYYRKTKSNYYSKALTAKGVILIITKLTE